MSKKQSGRRIEASRLRMLGYTYCEINSCIGVVIPKTTQYNWYRELAIPEDGKKRWQEQVNIAHAKAREAAVISRRTKRNIYLMEKESRNEYLEKYLGEDHVRRLLLAVLYQAEGTKGRSVVTFGNSDPELIVLFMQLFRTCFDIDESKFRCTLQLRADQNITKLEKFWAEKTRISPSLFYKARVDSRSIGKSSINKEYKGVCRIDYLNADLLWELLAIGTILKRARSSFG